MKLNNQLKLSKSDIKKGLRLPDRMSPELVEMIGIHFGDGNMQRRIGHDYRLSYSCNMHNKHYIDYISQLFKSLFNVSLTRFIMPEKSSLDLYCYSKVLCEFFNKELKVPYSPKKKLTIPDYILENELYLRRFLRGLFDTDGCTTISRTKGYSYRLIKISNISLDFAKEINLAYSFLGIRSYICNKNPGYDITIRRKESFKRFMELIEPKNN